jgi:hypothetical protein
LHLFEYWEVYLKSYLNHSLFFYYVWFSRIAGPLARPPATSLDVSPRNIESELSEIKALLSEYLKTPRPEDDRSRGESEQPHHDS